MKKIKPSSISLRRFNDFLTVIVVALGLYIFASPMMPAFISWWQRNHGEKSELIKSVETGNKAVQNYDKNLLIIPKLNLETEILTGDNPKTVNQGAWLRPNSGTPGSNNNSVIVGHRYSYNPGVSHPFYSLDLISTGDKIGVIWQNSLTTYTVQEVLVVEPTAVEIESATDYELLTLYTCTPLWTSDKRLVIKATPSEDGAI